MTTGGCRAALAAALMLLLAACGPAAERRFPEVSLRWAPTAQLGALSWIDLTGLGDRSIELRPFEDERPRRDRIGENRSDEPDVWPVRTGDDVAQFVNTGLAATLERVGLRLVDRDGDVVVRGAVRHLLLTERGGFSGEVALRVVAETPGGEALWEGLVLGAHVGTGRFDRSRGYSETLSDAVFDAVVRLLQNSELTEVLGDPRPRDDE
ncbi:MAG: hypothetical protein F9K16_11160 [Thermoanaerobaculia bacterium]|nr:MAG: hypothetical protein F9K16_11160 [Thermoanaerobaculia bacterium]MBZ0100837.1 hypothetical protein [Thermoanaerobaculia bacterium]